MNHEIECTCTCPVCTSKIQSWLACWHRKASFLSFICAINRTKQHNTSNGINSYNCTSEYTRGRRHVFFCQIKSKTSARQCLDQVDVQADAAAVEEVAFSAASPLLRRPRKRVRPRIPLPSNTAHRLLLFQLPWLPLVNAFLFDFLNEERILESVLARAVAWSFLSACALHPFYPFVVHCHLFHWT